MQLDSYGEKENKWVEFPWRKPVINYKRVTAMAWIAWALESPGIKGEMRDDK